MAAALEGNVEIVKVLLEKGANPSLMDDSRKTALKWAEDGENPQVINILKKTL
jgi:ankyrin repeat protein